MRRRKKRLRLFNMMLLTIVIFIFILGLLVLAHEFGHFLMAKRAGVKVEEFGFGFPPRLLSFRKGETIYSLNLIPIGGFVKIYGEENPEETKSGNIASVSVETEQLQISSSSAETIIQETETAIEIQTPENDQRAFYNKSIVSRAKILVAGVIFNLILAAFLFSIGHMLGLPTAMEDNLKFGQLRDQKIQIVMIAPDSPAAKAGIIAGDTIKKISLQQNQGVNVQEVKEVQDFIEQNKNQEIVLTIERGKEILDFSVVPLQNPPSDEGPIGIALAKTALVSYPWYWAAIKGIEDTFNLFKLMVKTLAIMLYRLVAGLPVGLEVAGPVGIFVLAQQASQLGLIYLLQFTAFISINLAIINILPFPALDGGRLLFLAIEKIRRKPVSQKVEKAIHTAGFAFLIALMLLVTIRDLTKIF